MNIFPNFASTKQAAEYVRDNFRWTVRESLAPGPRPLPLDYHDLYPCLVEMVYNSQSRPEMTSRLRDVPPLSSDEESVVETSCILPLLVCIIAM